MKETKSELLCDRIYHGRPATPVAGGDVDRISVVGAVSSAADRLPYTPPQIGMTFEPYQWGPDTEVARIVRRSGGVPGLAAGRADLAYAILDDAFAGTVTAVRYANSFDAQVLQSIPATVAFQIRRSQVIVWVVMQQKADGSLGHSELGGQPPNPPTYVCPVCGSLEFETSIRKAGAWCSFYPIEEMISADPLAMLGEPREKLPIPPALSESYRIAHGFSWSDAAHAAAGVTPCVFGPGRRVGISAGGDK